MTNPKFVTCSVNQATNSTGIFKIIIIMDSIHTVRKIFSMLSYLFQIHTASILKELCLFFFCSQENLIKFWECPSRCNWSFHKVVDKETKFFNPIPLLPCKSSWDYKQFLDLFDSDDNIIELSYIKGGSWLIYFSHSNSLYTRASRVITNHAPTSEYRLRFFPREDFSYSYSLNSIKTKRYILHECRRFN